MPNLRTQAAADLQTILADEANGFGQSVTVTDPAGTTVELVGFTADIGTEIDPQTGELVAGRRASVSLPIAGIQASDLIGLPANVSNRSSKPWVMQFDSHDGTTHTFKVAHSMPDRAAGVVTCILEAYRAPGA